MKKRAMLLLGATFIVHSLANASSVGHSEPGDYRDSERRQSYNPASVEISEKPTKLRRGLGYLPLCRIQLIVKNIATAHVTITTSNPQSKLVDVGGKDLPDYITASTNSGNACLRKIVPDLTDYEDLHGKEFTVTHLRPRTESEQAEDEKTIDGWYYYDWPLGLMIPQNVDRDFTLKVKVRANGYLDKEEHFMVDQMIPARLIIEGLPEHKKIKILGSIREY